MDKHQKNFQLLIALADRLSYKPGYNFLVERIDTETARVSLRCKELPDSQPDEEVVGLTVNNTVQLSDVVIPGDALQAFARVVADFEIHEAAEFFKFDGHQIFLPHGWDLESGGFTWNDFINLNGKFLRALKWFLKGF